MVPSAPNRRLAMMGWQPPPVHQDVDARVVGGGEPGIATGGVADEQEACVEHAHVVVDVKEGHLVQLAPARARAGARASASQHWVRARRQARERGRGCSQPAALLASHGVRQESKGVPRKLLVTSDAQRVSRLVAFPSRHWRGESTSR